MYLDDSGAASPQCLVEQKQPKNKQPASPRTNRKFMKKQVRIRYKPQGWEHRVLPFSNCATDEGFCHMTFIVLETIYE